MEKYKINGKEGKTKREKTKRKEEKGDDTQTDKIREPGGGATGEMKDETKRETEN